MDILNTAAHCCVVIAAPSTYVSAITFETVLLSTSASLPPALQNQLEKQGIIADDAVHLLA